MKSKSLYNYQMSRSQESRRIQINSQSSFFIVCESRRSYILCSWHKQCDKDVTDWVTLCDHFFSFFFILFCCSNVSSQNQKATHICHFIWFFCPCCSGSDNGLFYDASYRTWRCTCWRLSNLHRSSKWNALIHSWSVDIWSAVYMNKNSFVLYGNIRVSNLAWIWSAV